jgi:hypothetical protein
MKTHDWSELKELTKIDWLKVAYGIIGSSILLIMTIYGFGKLGALIYHIIKNIGA